MIPVVLGAAYYSQCLPPNSYINVLDSPKAPADYLHYLDQNVGYYNKYFAWKRYYRIETFEYGWPYDLLCAVCHGLHPDCAITLIYTQISLSGGPVAVKSRPLFTEIMISTVHTSRPTIPLGTRQGPIRYLYWESAIHRPYPNRLIIFIVKDKGLFQIILFEQCLQLNESTL